MMEPFQQAVEEAGLEAVTNTAITQLVQADVNFPTVQRVSDHKNLAMVAK